MGYKFIFSFYHLYDPMTHCVEQSHDAIIDESFILEGQLCLPSEVKDPLVSLDPSTFKVHLANYDPLSIPSNGTFLSDLPLIPSSLPPVLFRSSSLATSLQLPIEEDVLHDKKFKRIWWIWSFSNS